MIKTEYNGHSICFDEASEEWFIDQEYGTRSRSLRTIKNAIDERNRSDRRIGIKALLADDGSDVVVDLLCTEEKDYETGLRKIISAWCVSKNGRKKQYLAAIVPLAYAAQLHAALAILRDAEEKLAKARQAMKAIPRHTAETLRADRDALKAK